MFKNVLKGLSSNHIIGLLALIFIILALGMYSQNKTTFFSGMSNNETNNGENEKEVSMNNNLGEVKPSSSMGENNNQASVSFNSHNQLPANCSSQAVANPADLLPKDTNSAWAKLNPSGSGDLENVNLLKSGYHIGIDTVGQSLRNANLQLRSEPANPQVNVGPWNNTTIEPDLMRVPLELGAAPVGNQE